LYHNEYENLIDFDPDLFTNVNRSSVSVDGAELSFNIETSASLQITGHVTYSDTKIENSTARLRGRPKWRAGGVIDWVINDRWQVVTSFLAMDDFWEVSIPTGGSFLDGYRKVDISVSYDVSESLQLAFSVDNVFGEEYQEAVGFFAPGARGRLLLEYRF
jgi:outer membrane cobalamin receptor